MVVLLLLITDMALGFLGLLRSWALGFGCGQSIAAELFLERRVPYHVYGYTTKHTM